jgi:nucleoside-diphosphate-sugar epimerase
MLANAGKKLGVKRFIYISSIKVNGEETYADLFKSSDLPSPEDAYGISKKEAEDGLLELHEKGIFEVVIIRPPLIYGKGAKANFALLLKLVDKKLPLPFGLVTNRRSLVSLKNLNDLIILCTYHPKAGGEVFLVSDEEDLSLKDLILLIGKIRGKRVILVPVPVVFLKWGLKILGRASFARRLFGNLQVDITHTKETLDWVPKYNFEKSFD